METESFECEDCGCEVFDISYEKDGQDKHVVEAICDWCGTAYKVDGEGLTRKE